MFGDPVTNPMGWEKVRLDEVTSIQTGSTPSRTNPDYYSGSMPWVKTTEIRGNEIFEAEESITEAGLRESNCKLFPRDTILVAMYGQGITRGRTGILKIPACTNQACAAILPCVAILPQFLFTYLKNQYEEIRRLGRGGNQPNLNLNMIKKFTILLPPIEIQENFVNQAAIIKKILEKGTISDRKSTNFFNSLLQRAFKGELSFNNNYIDQLLACDSENKTISSEIGTKLCRLI
jgi:type I restriction enzyme S subunit